MWRQDEQAGQSYTLKLTAAGARAIAIATGSASEATSEATDPRLQVTTTGSEVVKATATHRKPVRAPRRHEAGAGPRIASARLWRNPRRTDCGDGLASAYHARCAYGTAQARLRGDDRPTRQGARIDVPRPIGRDNRDCRCNRSKRHSARNIPCREIEERSTRRKAASATGSVMSQGRRSATSERVFLSRRRRRERLKRSRRLSRALPPSTPTSFVFNGAIIWAARLLLTCRAGFS